MFLFLEYSISIITTKCSIAERKETDLIQAPCLLCAFQPITFSGFESLTDFMILDYYSVINYIMKCSTWDSSL